MPHCIATISTTCIASNRKSDESSTHTGRNPFDCIRIRVRVRDYFGCIRWKRLNGIVVNYLVDRKLFAHHNFADDGVGKFTLHPYRTRALAHNHFYLLVILCCVHIFIGFISNLLLLTLFGHAPIMLHRVIKCVAGLCFSFLEFQFSVRPFLR